MHIRAYRAAAACALGLLPMAPAAGQTGSNAFNPDISLILDGQASAYSSNPDDYAIAGFLLDEEVGLEPEGLSLGESELTLSANVDDRFYGFFTAALSQDGGETTVEIEEAYLQTLTLPAGLTLKAGRFFSDIGYLNVQHAHAWDFADEPLVYRALLGGQLGDTGLQLRWVAPADIFVELGAEALRGEGFPAGGAANDGFGAWTAFAHLGGDLGASHAWRAGVAYVTADSEGRDTDLGPDGVLTFTGDSDVALVDFVWKWSENGNPRTRNFVVQAEYMQRDEDGTLALDPAGGSYDGSQDGYYIQGVYQWRPKWRVGLRYDRLSADNLVQGLDVATPLAADFHSPDRVTVMVDWSHSEFSRLRLQAARDRSRPDEDSQIVLQYIMSLGAHGAHRF